MRLRGSSEVLEERRRRALALLDRGESINAAGRAIGCSPSSVLRWRRTRDRYGEKGLKVRVSPGRPAKLTEKQKGRLVRVLLRGATASGFSTELWTTIRIAEVIRQQFGVTYDRNHVGRMLHGLGWSHQKPQRRAAERDEAEIERWRREEWPRIKKTLRGWAPTSFSRTSPASS